MDANQHFCPNTVDSVNIKTIDSHRRNAIIRFDNAQVKDTTSRFTPMPKHPYETFWIPVLLGAASVLAGFASSLPRWAAISLWILSAIFLLLAGWAAYKIHNSPKSFRSHGGRGGYAESFGSDNTSIGGNGGDANGGIGGAGGGAIVKGKGSIAKGGNGGAG